MAANEPNTNRTQNQNKSGRAAGSGEPATKVGPALQDTQPINSAGKSGGATTSKAGSDSASYQPYDQARQKAGEVIDQVQEKAGEMVDQVKETTSSQISSQLSTQKERVAEGLESVVQMIRMTGNQLRQNDQRAVAMYTDKAADSVENISTFLRNRDLGEMVSEVENFARREPVLFLGGAFTLGLLAARFIKSSSSSQSSGAGGQMLARRPADQPYAASGQTRAPLTPPPYNGMQASDFGAMAAEDPIMTQTNPYGQNKARTGQAANQNQGRTDLGQL